MISRFLGAAAVAAIMGCAVSSAAIANVNVLPDPTFGGLFSSGGASVPISGPGRHSGAGGALVAILSAEPFPSVFASAQVAGPAFTATFAELDYDMEVTGPTDHVLVDVSGWFSISSLIGNGPSAALYVDTLIFSSINYPPDGVMRFYNIPVSLPTDTPIPVALVANAGGNTGSGLMTAYIDPYFSIDPSNGDAEAYSILTSPGVGNTPSPGVPGTPEPSTWAMLLLGFAGLTFAGYGRSRTPGSAPFTRA